MGDALQTLFLFAKILCRTGEQGRDLLQGSTHPSFTFPALSLPAAGAAKKEQDQAPGGSSVRATQGQTPLPRFSRLWCVFAVLCRAHVDAFAKCSHVRTSPF